MGNGGDGGENPDRRETEKYVRKLHDFPRCRVISTKRNFALTVLKRTKAKDK